MAHSNYTDPAVQNKTQDETTDYVDNLHSQPIISGKNKKGNKDEKVARKITEKEKVKGFKEGNKNDTPAENGNDDYYDIGNDLDANDVNGDDDDKQYGRGL